jgi:hypothetical protein
MCTVLLPPGVNPIAVNKYIKYTVITVHSLTSYRGNSGVVPLILNLGPRCTLVISITLRQLYPWERIKVPIEGGGGWVDPRAGLDFAEKRRKTEKSDKGGGSIRLTSDVRVVLQKNGFLRLKFLTNVLGRPAQELGVFEWPVSAGPRVNILIIERDHGGSVSSGEVLDHCQDRGAFPNGSLLHGAESFLRRFCS